jgi:hypothetical protein
MKIGVADATGLGLDQDLAGCGGGDVPLPEHQGLSELLDDRGLHLDGHERTLASNT